MAQDLEKVATSLVREDLQSCQKEYPECAKIFEQTLLKESDDIATQIRSAKVFGTVYEVAQDCHRNGKAECDLLKDKLTSCDQNKDPFSQSICLKKLTLECQKDFICMTSWGYAFRDDFKVLKDSSIELYKVFRNIYEKDKAIVSHNIKLLGQERKSSLINFSDMPAPNLGLVLLKNKTISTSPMTKPLFKSFITVKDAFFPSMKNLLQPWIRGKGMTVADWNGDGYLDFFTVEGSNVLFFENLNGKEFKKHIINFPSATLVDVSIADIDGNGIPVLLVQTFSKRLFISRWIKEKKTFETETIALPNFSRTHAFVKFKNGLGIIFPGWNGITSIPNLLANDYLARIVNKKWIFEKLSDSDKPSLGISVVEEGDGSSTVFINKDLDGGVDIFRTVGDNLVKIPNNVNLNWFSHSSANLKTKGGNDLWITAGLGFDKDEVYVKRIKQNSAKKVDDCKKETSNEREYCLINLNKNYTYSWPSLCKLYKNSDSVKICEMQNERSGIVDSKDSFVYTPQVFKNVEVPIIDITASKVAADMGQIWHMASIQSPSLEGFLIAEGSLSQDRPRKLWWMSQNNNGFTKVDLELPGFDSTQFSLADFDKDGQVDILYRSGNDLVILKGDTGGNSVSSQNSQSGFLSRTLIKIPSIN